MSTIYKIEGDMLCEQPTMSLPICFDEVEERKEMQRYENHLASLKKYSLGTGWLPEDRNRDIRQGEFVLQHQLYNSQTEQWKECSKSTYLLITDKTVRIIANKVDPAELDHPSEGEAYPQPKEHGHGEGKKQRWVHDFGTEENFLQFLRWRRHEESKPNEEQVEQAAKEYAKQMMGLGEYNEKWNHADKMMFNTIVKCVKYGANWQASQSGEGKEAIEFDFIEWANQNFIYLSYNKWDGDGDETYTTKDIHQFYNQHKQKP